jgi:hypothetical protein
MKYWYRLTPLLILMTWLTALPAQENDVVTVRGRPVTPASRSALTALDQQFTAWQTLQFDVVTLHQQVTSPGFRHRMDWYLDDRKIRLYLIPYDIRSEEYQLKVLTENGAETIQPGPSHTYRGWNLDDPSKEVRLSITPDYIAGFMTDVDGTEWFIQPGSDFSSKQERYSVVYRAQDAHGMDAISCGTEDRHHIGTDRAPSINPHARAASCVEARVAIAADYSMYQKYGNNAQNLQQHLLDVKNLMEPNYSVFNVEFRVVTTYIVTTSNGNPWSSSTDPNTVLNSFSCWAGSGTSEQLNCTGLNGFGVTHDVGELWTNRNFDGSTVGIAWGGTVCNSMFKYSVDQHFTTDLESLRVLIAHECGHNFGASHDASTSSAAYIMEPSVDADATTFSSVSQNAINSALPGFTCLPSCSTSGGGDCASSLTVTQSTAAGYKEASNSIQTSGTIDLSASATYNAPTVQIGSSFTVANGTTFEIRNTGCDP